MPHKKKGPRRSGGTSNGPCGQGGGGRARTAPVVSMPPGSSLCLKVDSITDRGREIPGLGPYAADSNAALSGVGRESVKSVHPTNALGLRKCPLV